MPLASRILAAALAYLVIHACASDGETGLRYEEVLRFASNRLAEGDAQGARAALSEIRFQEGERSQRARFHLLLGDANLRLGSHQEAADAYFRARELVEEDDAAGLRQCAFGLGVAHQELGRWSAARRHLLEALGLTDEKRLRDRVLIRLAQVDLQTGNREAARAWLDRVADRSVFRYEDLRRRLEAPVRPQRPEVAASAPSTASSSTSTAPRRRGAAQVRPAPSRPRIEPRSEWGAGALRMEGEPRAMGRIDRITVHHGGDGETAPFGRREAAAVMRRYQAWHFEKGWADIGYHFVIDGSGRVWEGRRLDWEGAHAGTQALNEGNVGICLMGTFEDVEPSPAALLALEGLIRWLVSRHGIDPRRIVGHDEALDAVPDKGTSCPGERLSRRLSDLRGRMLEEIRRGLGDAPQGRR